MPTQNDYMYEAWRSMFQAAGAPPPAIPGLGAFNNPYAFSIQGAGAAMGMPPGIAGGQAGQMIQQFMPMALQLLTGNSELADRLVSNNRALPGNVTRAQQSQAILGALNETARGATQQNIAGAIDAAGLGDVLGNFGVESNQAANFFMQAAPFIDPSLANMINRFDPGGGSLGLGTALYQSTLSGTRNTRINENTASILGEQFQRAFTQQRQFAGGEFRLLNQQATSGLTLPQMGVLMQQSRARGITGDVLAGSGGLGLLERLATGANDELRPQIEDVVAQVRSGDLTAAEGLGRLQDRGLVSSTRAQEERESAIQENLQRDQPQLEMLSRSVAQAGTIFETLQDNIPALLEQIEKMSGNLQNVNENEIRQALSKFQSLVEISGTSAEVLAEQAQVISSRVGVSFERGARLATDVNLTTNALQETGLNTRDARSLASTDLTFLEGQALASQRVQNIANASQFATQAGQERIQRAVTEGDAAFLANPLQALIDAGQVTDVEAARAIQSDIASGRRLSTEAVGRILSGQGLEAGEVAIADIQARAVQRMRSSLGEEGAARMRRGIEERFNAAAEDAGIEGRLGDLTDEQALQVAGLSTRVQSGQISSQQAAALMARTFGTGTLDPEEATRFFRSVAATSGRRLSNVERAGLGLAMTFEMSQEEREAVQRDQKRIERQTNRQLENLQFNRGASGFLKLIGEGEDVGAREVLEAALVSGGVLMDEDAFGQFDADQLTNRESRKIQELKRRIQNAEDPDEAARLQKQLSQFAAEVGARHGFTVDRTVSASDRRARQRLREQLGGTLPTGDPSEELLEQSGELAAIDTQIKTQKEAVQAAKQKREQAVKAGDRDAVRAANRELLDAEQALEKSQGKRGDVKERFDELVQTAEETAARRRDDEEGGEERESRRSKEESESREGSGTEKTVKLAKARIVLETDIGNLIGEMVDAHLEASNLANKTEQPGFVNWLLS